MLPRLGIRADFVDTTDLDRVEASIGPDTRGIYIETPSNPTLKVTDLRGVSRLAKDHGLLTLVDNTFLTPCLQRPLEWGADLVIHSATKFISGHSDVVSGAVVVREKELAEEIAFLQNTLGSILGVQDSWLTLRGLKTLNARMAAAEAAADRIGPGAGTDSGGSPGLLHRVGRPPWTSVAGGSGRWSRSGPFIRPGE